MVLFGNGNEYINVEKNCQLNYMKKEKILAEREKLFHHHNLG